MLKLGTENLCLSFPVFVFQSLIVESLDLEARVCPSGDHFKSQTQLECPFSLRENLPVLMFQIPMVVPLEPDASILPSGDQAMELMLPECRPSSFQILFPCNVSQMSIVASAETIASI